MNALIVVAHPDDEVLGCGGTGAALAASGHAVRACILAAHAEARGGRPQGAALDADLRRAQALLGFGEPILGSFPNIRLNSVPHLELVQFIEAALVATRATVVFTHHPSDINDDHAQVSRACQAAARLPQRRPGLDAIERLLFMEIPSSTDWSYAHAGLPFEPDTFVAIGAQYERKIEALRAYSGVMRPYPHPRSEDSLRALAVLRGSQAGVGLAESFVTAHCAGTVEQIFGDRRT